MATEEETVGAATLEFKCCVRGCKRGDEHLLLECYHCKRLIHEDCCNFHVLIKNKLSQPKNADGNNVVVCTKKCFSEVEKMLESGSRFLWEKDGKDGPDDPRTSEAILVEWLTEGDNFVKYRGYKNGGTRKLDTCQKIADIINREGVMKVRSKHDVRKKIFLIEGQMRKALDWERGDTGAGLLYGSEVEKTSFRKTLLKKCKHFDVLEGLFRDRAMGNPMVTDKEVCDEDGYLLETSEEEEEDREVEQEAEEVDSDVDDDEIQIEERDIFDGLVRNDSLASPIQRINALGLRGAPDSDSDVSKSVGGGSKKKVTGSEKQSLSEKFEEETRELRAEKRRARALDARMKQQELDLKREENILKRQKMDDAKEKMRWDALASQKDYEMKNLNYRLEMIEKLEGLLKKNYSYSQIADLVPSLIDVFPADEKEKYRKDEQDE